MDRGDVAHDDESFDAAFDRLFRVAYKSAYRVLRSREDSEDVAIDALAKASVRWRSIRGHADPWITTVSTRLGIDTLRGRRATTELVDAVETEIPIAEHMDLRGAIDRLPKRQRMTISLRYLSGLSESEIADVLRCSTGTVKQHTSRGVAALRRDLGNGAVTP
jgi:RNA polymerase sigma factor (sigma-70 family)